MLARYSPPFCSVGLILLLRCVTAVIPIIVSVIPMSGQVPQLITVQLYLEQNGSPIVGSHTIDVRWYGQASGGLPMFEESFNVNVELGIVSVLLGSVRPLVDSLLNSGTVWLGISVDGDVELLPRTILASVPYSIVSDRARIAQALAPEVTGVVTSVNEIAGVVRIEAGDGIRVSRNGKTLTIASNRVLERGVVKGTDTAHVFYIQPTLALSPSMLIDIQVSTEDSIISCFIKKVDLSTNTITVVTSAPLLYTESLEWVLIQ